MKHLKVVCVIVLGFALVFVVQRFLASTKKSASKTGAAMEQPVIVEPAEKRKFEARIEALGTAHANESVDITATVSERVSKIYFEAGARVAAGELLLKLEDDEELAALEEARVNLAEQRREFERVKELREKQVASQQELDKHQSAMESASARLAVAEARLRDRAITAPFAGVIGLRRVSPGAMVTPGTVITTLDDVSLIKARFTMPETVLGEITQGQMIEAGSAAWPETLFSGAVVSVDSRVNPGTRAITVEAHIPNPESKLRPGMLLTVTLISRSHEAVGVPEKAVLSYAEKDYVFVLKPDKTVGRRELRVGARDFGWVEALDGLAEGEMIVVEGVMDLKDGSPVRPIEAPSIQRKTVGAPSEAE